MDTDVDDLHLSQPMTFVVGVQRHPEWPSAVFFAIGMLLQSVAVLLTLRHDQALPYYLDIIFNAVGFVLVLGGTSRIASNARDVVVAERYIAFRNRRNSYREFSWRTVRKVLLVGSGDGRFLRVDSRFGWWVVRPFPQFDLLLEQVELRTDKRRIERGLTLYWLLPILKALAVTMILLSLFFSILPGD